MQLYNIYRLYVKKYNLSVQFLLTSAAKEAMTLTGRGKDSFYRLVKKYEAEFKNTQEEMA